MQDGLLECEFVENALLPVAVDLFVFLGIVLDNSRKPSMNGVGKSYGAPFVLSELEFDIATVLSTRQVLAKQSRHLAIIPTAEFYPIDITSERASIACAEIAKALNVITKKRLRIRVSDEALTVVE